MPILTVGLPVYNAMPFLPETVDSLLKQDYQNFNVLIIDDGSTDGSADYLKTVKDSRVRIVRQENSGLTFTLNRMLREAGTPWLVRHDADDIAYPNRIKLIIDYIQKYPEAGMFYSLANYYQDNNRFGKFRTTIGSPSVLTNLTRAGYLLAVCHPTVTLNIEKTLAVGGYRFNLFVEDVDLWWRMALQNEIVLIPEFTVGVRHNLSSICGENLETNSINTFYIQYLLISHLWGVSPLPYDEVKNNLVTMVDRRRLQFRENIRRANVHAGKREYTKAITYAAKSLIASPGHFLKRVGYELGNKEIAVNGLEPKRFAELSNVLWREQD